VSALGCPAGEWVLRRLRPRSRCGPVCDLLWYRERRVRYCLAYL